jgi:hypothetical protein
MLNEVTAVAAEADPPLLLLGARCWWSTAGVTAEPAVLLLLQLWLL